MNNGMYIWLPCLFEFPVACRTGVWEDTRAWWWSRIRPVLFELNKISGCRPTHFLRMTSFTNPPSQSKSIPIALLRWGKGTHPNTLHSNWNPKRCFGFFPLRRGGLVNCLKRGFCAENEAGQSGATQLGTCGMSFGSSRPISITQAAIKATGAQSPGNWLKASQTHEFQPWCCLVSADVCGLPKKNSSSRHFPWAATRW